MTTVKPFQFVANFSNRKSSDYNHWNFYCLFLASLKIFSLIFCIKQMDWCIRIINCTHIIHVQAVICIQKFKEPFDVQYCDHLSIFAFASLTALHFLLLCFLLSFSSVFYSFVIVIDCQTINVYRQ